MRSLLLAFWQRLLSDLGLRRSPLRSFHLEERLVRSLEDLAEREERSKEEVAVDLLSFALAQRNAAEVSLIRWRALSPREQQVAALVCLNLTNSEIAERLVISPETVKTHVRNVLNKFGLHSKTELRLAMADWDFSAWQDQHPK